MTEPSLSWNPLGKVPPKNDWNLDDFARFWEVIDDEVEFFSEFLLILTNPTAFEAFAQAQAKIDGLTPLAPDELQNVKSMFFRSLKGLAK